MSETESPVHGTAWVQNGLVGVSPPGPGGIPATVTPSEGVEVFVAGERAAGPTPVLDAESIQVRVRSVEPSVSYKVTLAGGGLEALLTVVHVPGATGILTDAAPCRQLVVRAVKTATRANPSVPEALECIRSKGVKVDIDLAACHRACTGSVGESLVVARGEPFTPGKDAALTVHTIFESVVDLATDETRVDFREIFKKPDIKAGGIIVSKTNPEVGVPGVSVTGEPLLPPRPKDIHLRAGKGVELHEEGNTVTAVAAISGCPGYDERTGIVSVNPVVTHPGDIDLKSGNVRSSGSLVIGGQVSEKMVAQAEGTLEIRGAVSEATISAWGSIRLWGNVFKSTVSAGKDVTWVSRVYGTLKDLEAEIDSILTVEEHLDKASGTGDGEGGDDEESPEAAKRAADFTKLLENVYYVQFRKVAGFLCALYREDLSPMPEDTAASLLSTKELFLNAAPVLFQRAREIGERSAPALVWAAEELQKGESDILLPYAQGAVLEASRDIHVTGSGAVYSALTAGRQIKVTGSPGVFRGGTARAGQLIHINHAGAAGSVATTLQVGALGRIVVSSLSADTTLIVGLRRYRTTAQLENVTATLADGELRIRSDSGPVTV